MRTITPACNHPKPPSGFLDGGFDQVPKFRHGERENFARPSAYKKRHRFALNHPGNLLTVSGKIDFQIVSEWSYGK